MPAERADAAKAKFMQGTFNIYTGPMKDNTGKQVIAAGTEYDNRALWLEGMDWLLKGCYRVSLGVKARDKHGNLACLQRGR